MAARTILLLGTRKGAFALELDAGRQHADGSMAVVHVPRSLAALFPGVPRQLEVPADDLAELIHQLDTRYLGMWDRLCQPGPRLRPHINAFVDGRPAAIDAPLTESSVVHVIPAVSGGAGGHEPHTEDAP